MKTIKDQLVHLDIYLAAAVAVAASIYSAIAKETNTTAVVLLASITAVLTALLGIRIRVDKILESAPTAGRSIEWSSSYPADFTQNLKAAREIWVSGVHRNEFLLAHQELMLDLSKRDIKIRFLFVDPASKAIAYAAARYPDAANAAVHAAITKEEVSKVDRSIVIARNLGSGRQNIETRVVDFLPSYGIILVDPTNSNCSAFVEHFTFRTQGGGAKPKTSHGKGSAWLPLYRAEFEGLWDAAKAV